MTRAGFVLHLDRCTGCSACRIACRIENRLGERSWRRVHSFNRQRLPELPAHHLSLACSHCADAPCVAGCPAAAIDRDPATGAVILHGERCMGCRYCSWVCPYGAPSFDAARGVMDKCTLCLPRLHSGSEPACVEACPVAALEHEPAMAPTADEPRSPGWPRLGLGPAVTIHARRRGDAPPEISPRPLPEPPADSPRRAWSWAGLRQVWSLLLFTLTITVLVAAFAAATATGDAVPARPFILGGIAAMALSLLHLGHPLNAWRAPLNLHRSWVSREIVSFSLFFALAAGVTILGIPAPAVRWLAVALGLTSLACVDVVYRVRGQEIAAFPHSATASLSGAGLIGVLTGVPLVIAGVGALKLALYLARQLERSLPRPPPPVVLLRLGAGFALPAALWLTGASWTAPVALAGLAVGELVDRAELYAGLRFLEPGLQIERDLRAAMGMD